MRSLTQGRDGPGQTCTDFEPALEDGSFDLILVDYAVPPFDRLSALELERAVRPEVPFILVSGTLGEEVAIETTEGGPRTMYRSTEHEGRAPEKCAVWPKRKGLRVIVNVISSSLLPLVESLAPPSLALSASTCFAAI